MTGDQVISIPQRSQNTLPSILAILTSGIT
jgi:hypothetical protein